MTSQSILQNDSLMHLKQQMLRAPFEFGPLMQQCKDFFIVMHSEPPVKRDIQNTTCCAQNKFSFGFKLHD